MVAWHLKVSQSKCSFAKFYMVGVAVFKLCDCPSSMLNVRMLIGLPQTQVRSVMLGMLGHCGLSL